MFEVIAVSLFLTLVFELAFALAFKTRGRDLWLVALVNALTNPAVVLLHALARDYTQLPLWLVTLFLEVLAVLVEALCYRHAANDIKKPLLFSAGANAFSYLMGTVINAIT